MVDDLLIASKISVVIVDSTQMFLVAAIIDVRSSDCEDMIVSALKYVPKQCVKSKLVHSTDEETTQNYSPSMPKSSA